MKEIVNIEIGLYHPSILFYATISQIYQMSFLVIVHINETRINEFKNSVLKLVTQLCMKMTLLTWNRGV